MRTFFLRRAQSFRYALAGFWHAVRTQHNVWIHLSIASAVVLMAIWLQLPARDWAILVLTMALVLAAEFFNTALEALVDLASPDTHPLAKTAKDVSAAAVLVAALAAVTIGLLLLGPPLWAKISVLF